VQHSHMEKQAGAFLTIGELSAQLGVPQHVLRYWETRFPQLRPLQRAGNRRYYRANDVALAQRIYQLLHVEGFTVRGAQLALTGKGQPSEARQISGTPKESSPPTRGSDRMELISRLSKIRALLAESLDVN
jgi:DNA-binding transcriptional MerR regulator